MSHETQLALLAIALIWLQHKRAHTAAGKRLAPGYYWWFVRWSTDRAALETWLRYNRESAYVAKALGYTSDDNAILILHVRRDVEWTLPGFPTPAPNGLSTTIPELERAPSVPVNALQWRNYLDRLKQQAIDDVLAFDEKVQRWLDGVLR